MINQVLMAPWSTLGSIFFKGLDLPTIQYFLLSILVSMMECFKVLFGITLWWVNASQTINFILKFPFSVLHMKTMKPNLIDQLWGTDEMINKKVLENNKLLHEQKVLLYVWCIIATTVKFGVKNRCKGRESWKIVQVWLTQRVWELNTFPSWGCLILVPVEEVPCMSPQHLLVVLGCCRTSKPKKTLGIPQSGH